MEEVIKEAEAVTDDFTTWNVSKHFGQPRAFVVRMAKKNVYTIGMTGIIGRLNTLYYCRVHQKK